MRRRLTRRNARQGNKEALSGLTAGGAAAAETRKKG
jgi:hypothetical protein